jgi:hypothetical protein
MSRISQGFFSRLLLTKTELLTNADLKKFFPLVKNSFFKGPEGNGKCV